MIRIFTDGSYLRKDKSCGYAAIFVDTLTNKIEKVYGRVVDEDLCSMWNVGGELQAVTEALNYCISKGYDNIEIIHDYSGVAHWVTGSWSSNKPTTKQCIKDYVKFVRNCKQQGMNIKFTLIKGHVKESIKTDDNRLNDMADEYANKGRKSDKTLIIETES